MTVKRDHGGGLDAAIADFGGTREGWADLSTGINPIAFPVPQLSADAWTALPDQYSADRLTAAARRFWNVPDGADILAAPGASVLIAQIPRLAAASTVCIPPPTYNEHAASFSDHGWTVKTQGAAHAQVLVNPNNPDGRIWSPQDVTAPLNIIDESFCDVMPARSLMSLADRPGTLILKSFGKFWGMAGLRLGFVCGDPRLVARLRDMLGPWPVSGIALEIGAAALTDTQWADQTRARLHTDAARLDAVMSRRGAILAGGTSLFRLYRVEDAAEWQARLARHHVWSRIFPYASDLIRLGLPAPNAWPQIESAL